MELSQKKTANKEFRNTKIRKEITSLFRKTKEPLSVPAILLSLKKKNMNPNKTTIYRHIKFLLQKGMIKEIEFGDGKKRYEFDSGHHHHLICQKCKRVEEVILDNELQKEEGHILSNKNFKVLYHMLEFFGICKQCQH